jgi:hypothetical protein
MTEQQQQQQQQDAREEDADSEEEGMQLLLSGVSSTQMTNVEWPEDEVPNDNKASISFRRKKPQSAMESRRVDLSQCTVSPLDAQIMCNAHAWNASGHLIPPAVQVVDFGSRGNGLVTTVPIKKGSTIFTERALYANSSHEPACCNCWRSMSPLDAVGTNMPQPQLWPTTSMESSSKCQECSSLFCSPHCRTQHGETYGTCCRLRACLDAVPRSEEAVAILQLATVVFVAAVHGFRTTRRDDALLGPIIDNLCGSAMDVKPLELDESLESIYSELVRVLELTPEEQQFSLSQDRLATYISIVARNSFGGHTKNPFDSYYAALTRPVRLLVQEALGGVLNREVDRAIHDKVVVPFAALLGLTARINHSCDPNAQVSSQNYMDCHMDLVARRDLEAGEEVLISYLAETKARTANRRRTMLQAKYQFWCDCSRCTEGEAVVHV